jgi:ubiquinone biosynthesis protein COQ9
MPRRVCLEESEATAIVDKKIRGLKIKLGLARVKAKRAATLDEKIAAKRLEKNLQEELRVAYRSYFDDIAALLERDQ